MTRSHGTRFVTGSCPPEPWPWLRERATYRGEPRLPADGRATRYDRLNLIVRAAASGQNGIDWHIGLVYGDYPAPHTQDEWKDIYESAGGNHTWTERATGSEVETLCGQGASVRSELDLNAIDKGGDCLVETWRKEDAPATCGHCLNRLQEIPSLAEALDMLPTPDELEAERIRSRAAADQLNDWVTSSLRNRNPREVSEP